MNLSTHPLFKYFNDFRNGIILRKDINKTILKVVDRASFKKPLLIKIYHTTCRIKRMKNFLFWYHGGMRDFRVCRKLLKRGILVPEPVGACADGPMAGLARRTLFACHWIEDGYSVLHIFRQMGKNTNRFVCSAWSQEEFLSNFMIALGRFIADLHQKRVRANDLNPGNILCQIMSDGRFRFFLIDYEGVSLLRPISKERMVYNLAQVAAVPTQVLESSSNDLCLGYSQISNCFEYATLCEQVARRASDIRMQWKSKMDHNFEKIAHALKAMGSRLEK